MPWGKACILQFTVQFPIISTVVHTKSYIHAPNWSPWASKLAIEFPWHVKLQKTQFISPSIICFFKKLNFSFISSFYAMFCCLKIQGGYLFFYQYILLCSFAREQGFGPCTQTHQQLLGQWQIITQRSVRGSAHWEFLRVATGTRMPDLTSLRINREEALLPNCQLLHTLGSWDL